MGKKLEDAIAVLNRYGYKEEGEAVSQATFELSALQLKVAEQDGHLTALRAEVRKDAPAEAAPAASSDSPAL